MDIRAIEFKLDEKRLLETTDLTLEEVYDYIDRAAVECHLQKVRKGYYECREKEETQAACLHKFTSLYLKDEKWFMDNVYYWYWIINGRIDGDIKAKVYQYFGIKSYEKNSEDE